jgi:hypothetical protein
MTASYNLSQLGSQYTVTSWTPVITFGGASTGITYSQQQGSWTRMGNIFLLEAFMILTSKGTATGKMQITGLPISFPTATGEFAIGVIRAGFQTGLGGGTGSAMGISGVNGSSNLDVYQWSATGITDYTDANATNTSTYFISLTCIV